MKIMLLFFIVLSGQCAHKNSYVDVKNTNKKDPPHSSESNLEEEDVAKKEFVFKPVGIVSFSVPDDFSFDTEVKDENAEIFRPKDFSMFLVTVVEKSYTTIYMVEEAIDQAIINSRREAVLVQEGLGYRVRGFRFDLPFGYIPAKSSLLGEGAQGIVVLVQDFKGNLYAAKILKKVENPFYNFLVRIGIQKDPVLEEKMRDAQWVEVFPEARVARTITSMENVLIKKFAPGKTLKDLIESGEFLDNVDGMQDDLKNIFQIMATKKTVFGDLNACNLIWDQDNKSWIIIDSFLKKAYSTENKALKAAVNQTVLKIKRPFGSYFWAPANRPKVDAERNKKLNQYLKMLKRMS